MLVSSGGDHGYTRVVTSNGIGIVLLEGKSSNPPLDDHGTSCYVQRRIGDHVVAAKPTCLQTDVLGVWWSW